MYLSHPDRPQDIPYTSRTHHGETGEGERNGCATLESADAEVDGRAAGTRCDAQVEGERAEMR